MFYSDPILHKILVRIYVTYYIINLLFFPSGGQVLSTDIVMDVGRSLNPAIDVGQIEGAFMQGYGLFTLEELVYSPKGVLYTRGPGTYKIPGFSDVPKEFTVSLLEGSENPRAVYSSKVHTKNRASGCRDWNRNGKNRFQNRDLKNIWNRNRNIIIWKKIKTEIPNTNYANTFYV